MDDLTADQLSFFDATYDTCYDKMLQDSTTCIEWQNLFGSDSFLGSDMTAREALYDGLSMWLPPASSSSSWRTPPRASPSPLCPTCLALATLHGRLLLTSSAPSLTTRTFPTSSRSARAHVVASRTAQMAAATFTMSDLNRETREF